MIRCMSEFTLSVALVTGCTSNRGSEDPGDDNGATIDVGGARGITSAGGDTAIAGGKRAGAGGNGGGSIGITVAGGNTAATGVRGGVEVGGTGGGQSGRGGAGTTGDAAGPGGTGGTVAPTAGTDSAPSSVADYGAPGPFSDAKMFKNVGPNNSYTMFRPDASLGRDGFKHPLVSWGNGITTTPQFYREMLTLVATHGFVIIATNDTTVEEAAVVAGLDWLAEQNKSGDMAGKLDNTREATIGYSWGGGASIDAANRDAVLCTVSLHGMPPRRADAFATMHAPLLLTTSTGDEFVTASEYVTPNYEKSTVQTFYGTLGDSSVGHLYIAENNVDSALICGGGALLGTYGSCGGAAEERAPLIAWLRLWVYGDQGARKYFYGNDCLLCRSPWTTPQRKKWQ
jgi:hypothetical protein